MLTSNYASITAVEPDVFQFDECVNQTLPQKVEVKPQTLGNLKLGFETHRAFYYPETDDLNLVNYHKEQTLIKFHVTNLDTCVRVIFEVPDEMLSNNFIVKEHEVWTIVNNYKSENEHQLALINLFSKLHDSLSNISYCNNFLLCSMNKKLSSDEIVHVLNALSPIKNELTNWQNFVIHSYNLLKEKGGEKYANTLLRVII